MAERTGIAWCHHTENFWYGCTQVSPACDHCYAKALVNGRMGGNFDNRVRTVPSNWRKPFSWNRAAKAAGERRRVFSLSLGDFFDNQVPEEWRADAWSVIRECDALDWLILTKRPQNIRKMLPPDWGDGWPNVWLGCTVENQEEADRRIPHLLAVPSAVHFLSAEPLLGPLNIGAPIRKALLDGEIAPSGKTRPIDWVIVGGESGHGARVMRYGWAADLLTACQVAGVPAFFKQVGTNRDPEWPPGITGKGDDPEQWPEWWRRFQQFPAREAA